MIPRAGVVAGPCGGIALPAGVGGAGQDKGPQIGIELEQAFECGAGILHAVDIMNFQVICRARPETWFVDAVLRSVRHGEIIGKKNRGLVHVVPKARNAFRQEILILGAPPLPGFLAGKVREN